MVTAPPAGQDAEMLRKAYSLGINPIVATDVAIYAKMTLEDIASEWSVCPVELLAALAVAFPSNSQTGAQLPPRRDGETFGDYMRRTLGSND